MCRILSSRPCFWPLLLQLSILILSPAANAYKFAPPPQRNVTETAAVAMCAAVKDENANIREWIHYHYWIGVHKFYIFDHNSSVPILLEIQDWVTSGIAEYVRFSGHNSHTVQRQFKLTGQGYAYASCLTLAKRNGHKWGAFLDPDEFIVLYQDDHRNLGTFLDKYDAYGALVLNWRVFGSSGHKHKPEEPALLAYNKCHTEGKGLNKQFKSIVNLPFTTGLRGNPHQFRYEEGKVAVNEDLVEIPGFFSKQPQFKAIGLHHYVLRSFEEFQAKMIRGGGAGKRRSTSYWDYVDKLAVGDCRQGAEIATQWLQSTTPSKPSSTAQRPKAVPVVVEKTAAIRKMALNT